MREPEAMSGPAPAGGLSASLRARLDRVVATVTSIEADGVDRAGRWPSETMRALGEGGFGGLVIPPEHGGEGLGLQALVETCEVLATVCASSAVVFGMHAAACAAVASSGSDEQARTLLAPMAAGRHFSSLALGEAGDGAGLWFPEATATRRGDQIELAGTKPHVVGGGRVESYVVSATTVDGGEPTGDVVLLAVPASAEGLTWGEEWDGLGLRGRAARAFTIDTALPPEARLGDSEDHVWLMFGVVTPALLAVLTGTGLGLASRALAIVRAQVAVGPTTVGGGSPADSKVVQHRLGDMWARIQRSRAFAVHAARDGEAGAADSLASLASARADSAEVAVWVVNESTTILGEGADRDGALLDRLLRDARALSVMAPTSDVLRVWTGRALLDLPLLGP